MPRRGSRFLAAPLLALVFAPAAAAGGADGSSLDPTVLGARWAAERFVATPAPCLKPATLEEELRRLAAAHPEIGLEEIGRSVRGRPIYRFAVGQGDFKVLLWSQMHGDEPSATPALLDIAHYLLSRREEKEVATLLERLTVVMVPMLNPDGAEAYTRRNAQGIDVNRDALNLATPEGRLLKALRDREQPRLGFNLHDQNRRRSVGTSRVLASNAVLAVVGDEAKTLTPGRVLAQRAAVAIAAALEPFAPGGLARYDDTFSPRSFGDNLTAWGTPVVLIESGGVPPRVGLEELTRLNFVALLATLGELAENRLEGRDPAGYGKIPENNADVYADVALRGGRLRQPGIPPYRADLAFDRRRGDREAAGCQPPGPPRSQVAELGDARIFGAGREVDASGQILFPAFTVGAEGWAARKLLDEEALPALARLGVAEVRWVVAPRDLGAAEAFAAKARGALRPRLGVSADPRDLPPWRLERRPNASGKRNLGALVAALAAACKAPKAELDAALEALWKNGPGLRYEGDASFLAARADADLEAASPVTWIFLDGLEVAP